LSDYTHYYLASLAPPQPTPHLTSTQDLLARFLLLPAYDKYVRPYVAPVDDGHDHPPTPGATDKGKGKEKELVTATPDDGQDADEEDGGKKKKNSYKHLIKGVPGRLPWPHFALALNVFAAHRETLDEERRIPDDHNASPS
jgi:hypothetical protein